ncbi:MAG: hypothetical protein IKQ92_03915 [Clostridia bacterium]|nr:hypothetical protein [Clostridia bacterium]
MKRILCLFLALLLFVLPFAACSESGENSDVQDDGTGNAPQPGAAEPEETEPEETELSDNLPDVKYEGYTFTAVTFSEGIAVEEITGEALNDALFERDKAVEERFDIALAAAQFDDYGQATEAVKRAVNAGLDDYDCGMLHMVSAAGAAQGGFFYSLDLLDAVDPTKPWWDTDCVDAFTVAGHMKLLCGMMLPKAMLRSSCMLFNKNRFTESGMEYPYGMVDEGTWTLDALYELTKDTTRDLNGDGVIKEMDDFWGLTQWYLDSPYSFYYGAGGRIVTKDADGVPILNDNLELNSAIYDKIYKIVIDNNSNYHTDIGTYTNSYEVFTQGRAFFVEASLLHLRDDRFRDMEDDYGVLPMPKYNELQERYMSFVNGAVAMLVVPSVCPNPERTGILLEGIAAESYRHVYDALFEVTAKAKSSRDPESTRMMDLVMACRVFDLGYSHMYDQAGVQFVRDLLVQKSTDIASYTTRAFKPMAKMLQKIVEAYEKSNEAQQ